MRKILTLFLFIILTYVLVKREKFSDYKIFKLLDLSLASDEEEPDSDIFITTQSNQSTETTQIGSEQNGNNQSPESSTISVSTNGANQGANQGEETSTTSVSNSGGNKGGNQGGNKGDNKGEETSTTSVSSSGGNQGGETSTTSVSNSGGNKVEPLCGFYVDGEPKFYNLNDTPTQQSGGGSICQVGQKLCPHGCYLDGAETSCLIGNAEVCNKTFSVLSDINPNENYQCSAPSYNSSMNCGSPVCYRPDNYERCNSTCTYVSGNSVNPCYFGCGSTNQGTLQVHSDSCEKCSGSNTIDTDISSDNYGRCSNNSDSMECKPNNPQNTFPCSQYESQQTCTSYDDCVWAAV